MDSVQESRFFDIIVFGATGYTGKYVMEELSKVAGEHNVKWGVAGRKAAKLKATLLEVQGWLENDDLINSVEIVEADVEDEESLSAMCQKTRLVLNCVGPYIFYGESVVRACIENGTHHVDVSGEFKYLEETQAKYFHAAREKEVYIVQSCGFDSIPADIGTVMMKERFNGVADSIQIYVKFLGGPEGMVTNIGTWLSAVNAVGYFFQRKKIRQNLVEKVFDGKMPLRERGFDWSLPVSYGGLTESWRLSLPSPDIPVIERTQIFRNHFFNETPVQNINVFFTVKSFISVLGMILLGAVFGLFSLFSFGRYLLEKFPGFFSAGYFSKVGPTRRQVMSSSMTMTLHGHGWGDDFFFDGNDDPNEATGLRSRSEEMYTLKISGPDPAYVLTSRCMVHAGLVILEEADNMPLDGGVLTPGAAFANTSLVSRLEKRGIHFEWENE